MASKRDQLVNKAIELFSAHGFHGTGIDRIAEEAQVSKKTMYHHFRSKEELILAALRQYDGVFRNQFMKAVDTKGNTAYDRLLGVFDTAHDWFSDNKFYGCMFINAAGEYSEQNTPIRKACKEFKSQMRSFIEELAQDAHVDDPEGIATQLALLLEGSIVTAQVSGNPKAAETAKIMAKSIVDDALIDRKAAN